MNKRISSSIVIEESKSDEIGIVNMCISNNEIIYQQKNVKQVNEI